MSVVAYKCSSCGGELKFNAEKENFTCEYCFSEFLEQDLNASTCQTKVEQALMYSCPNCGGEVITDETTASTECYYCHSPVVLSGKLEGEHLPKYIIPFKLDRNTAVDKFYKWTKKRFFLPKDFFSQKQLEKLTGVYFPYWIVDADNYVLYTASAERTNSWVANNTRFTTHKLYECIREGDVHLEDVVKSALKKSSKQLVENVQPFDEIDMKPFSMAYLSGYKAECRDIEIDEITSEVISDINFYTKKVIEKTVVGFTSVKEIHCKCDIKNINWDYGLLPIWTITYNYKSKIYYFAMNGQTGKICGKLPVDSKKLALFSILSGGFLAIITAIIGGYIL